MAEIVTGEMVLTALRAWRTGPGLMTGDAMRDALLAVAPLIRRAALEEAAEAVERRARELDRKECCGIGQGSPPECCGDPLLMLSNEEAATAILAMLAERDKGGGNG